jgi:hypothetical protein
MTDDHLDFIEGCEAVGWAIKYSRKAHDREWLAALTRRFG